MRHPPRFLKSFCIFFLKDNNVFPFQDELLIETMAELDSLKQQFADYEELLVELQSENEELKSGGGGGGGGDVGELKKLLDAERNKNKALQEEVCLSFFCV